MIVIYLMYFCNNFIWFFVNISMLIMLYKQTLVISNSDIIELTSYCTAIVLENNVITTNEEFRESMEE